MAEDEAADSGAGETAPESAPTSLYDMFDDKPEPAPKRASAEDKESDEKEERGSQKFPVGESSSEDDEKESKSDEKDEEKADDKSEKKPSEKKESKPADKKEEKPSDEKKADDKWESEDNPYRKRFTDTQKDWNRTHQENIQLKNSVDQMRQDMTILKKIADGTYDPEKDNPAARITPQDVATKALEVGKALASQNAAYSQFGKEKVEADLAEFHQLFGNNPQIQKLVLDHEAPVYEAFRILDRFRFEKQYGSNPAAIKEAIRAEYDKEMRASIRKELADELIGRADKKKAHPSFSSSRGSNGLGKDAKPKSNGPTSLKDIF